MVVVTIYLTPPLSGVQGAVYFVYAGNYYKVYDMPPSVNGLIQFDITTTSPEADYGIIFPEQTVEGVTYAETISPLFNLLSPVTLNMVLEPLYEEVSTTITISAPSSVTEGAGFNISGILIRNDTGGPIPSASISLSYNGISLGSATTGVDGDYLKTVSIPSSGSFTLKASFAGMSGLNGSEATKGISVGVIPMSEVLVPLVVGFSMVYFAGGLRG